MGSVSNLPTNEDEMRPLTISHLLLLIGLAVLTAGISHAQMVLEDPGSEQFRSYWYSKGAEISRFQLSQSRYGQIHKGDAVYIYVTEPMNPQLQVKADRPDEMSLPVLKLNATRKFYTGIYPYSIMTSVFGPVDVDRYPKPLKISFSSQEWCGHVFMQMNLRNNQYAIQAYSYFESEADRKYEVDSALPEDAIWTLIRTGPSRLPQGQFDIIPGTVYVRLAHQPLRVVKVQGKLSAIGGKSLEGNPLVQYQLTYPEELRVLRIRFEKEFPHRIEQWEETYSDREGRPMTTRAVRTHTIMSDYWNRHTNADRRLLKKLGLDAGGQG
jgi:hypothetical protein